MSAMSVVTCNFGERGGGCKVTSNVASRQNECHVHYVSHQYLNAFKKKKKHILIAVCSKICQPKVNLMYMFL